MSQTIEESVKKYIKQLGLSLDDKVSEEQAQQIRDFINYEIKRRKIETKNIQKDNEELAKWSIKDFIKGITSQISESPIEDCIYNALCLAGLVEFKQQYQVGKYRVDFAFPKERVCIEADGHQWHRENPQQIERDNKRDIYLAHRGWRTIHLEGIAIKRDLESCMAKINNALKTGAIK
jgi:very-short-patch-repair endonuclease